MNNEGKMYFVHVTLVSSDDENLMFVALFES